MEQTEMNVSLLEKTPNPRRVLFTAIRTCYSHLVPKEIYKFHFSEYEMKNATDGGPGTEVDRLFRQLYQMGHASVFEHVSFNFGISGVSRSLLSQLTRHRVGVAYSVQSQRYVTDKTQGKKGGYNFVVPPKIQNHEDAASVFLVQMELIQLAYDYLTTQCGIPAEDARFLLPNAAATNLLFSVNLRELIHLYKLRTGEGVQWEIKRLAEKLRDEAIFIEPWIEDFLN